MDGSRACVLPTDLLWPPLCFLLPQVSPLLSSAADLLRAFPSLFADCVVAVARKTDAQLWPALFGAVGSPRSAPGCWFPVLCSAVHLPGMHAARAVVEQQRLAVVVAIAHPSMQHPNCN